MYLVLFPHSSTHSLRIVTLQYTYSSVYGSHSFLILNLKHTASSRLIQHTATCRVHHVLVNTCRHRGLLHLPVTHILNLFFVQAECSSAHRHDIKQRAYLFLLSHQSVKKKKKLKVSEKRKNQLFIKLESVSC